MSDEEKKSHGEAGGEHAEEHKGHKKGHGGGHGHGGGAHEEHGGVAEWLISFADNVALLMGFFVILLAMNMNKPKPAHGLGGEAKDPGGSDDTLNELVYGIRDAFHSLPSLDSKDPKDVPLLAYMARRSRGETSTDGSLGLHKSQDSLRPSDYQAPTGSFSFEPYSTVIDSDGKERAVDLANRLRGQTFLIQVRGHTSAIEAGGGPVAALKLSYQRAQAVAELLVQSGLRWENLRLVACGDQERITPLASDRSEHKTNQRVEIIVTNETVSPDPHVIEPQPE
jgi:outer membrane protein OmpA-like peptidoglycan-associated protein